MELVKICFQRIVWNLSHSYNSEDNWYPADNPRYKVGEESFSMEFDTKKFMRCD